MYALMNNPGDASDLGTYTFGGETIGRRVVYFEKSGGEPISIPVGYLA